MSVTYWMYSDELKEHKEAVDKEQEVQMSIMDQAEKMWKRAKVVISTTLMEGGQSAGLLGPYGQPHDEGKYFVKIVEELPPEDLEEGE